METNRLIQFKTVVDCGGLIKASEILGITGGGLSKSIKVLEDEIQFKLFNQKGRGLELTEGGQIFYQKVDRIIRDIESLKNLKINHESNSSPIKLVSFEVFSTYFLAQFLQDENTTSPVEIRESTPGEMEQLIAGGHSDIGITYEPIPYQGVEFLKIAKIKMGIYTDKHTKYSKLPFDEIPFITPLSPIGGTPSGVKGLDGWPEHQISRLSPIKVDMMQTALLMTAQGLGACFIPEFIANAFNASSKNQLVELNSPKKLKKITRDVYIIKRKERDEDQIIKKLAKAIRKISS
jgi:DNA-binding transcriptional LysR family regulator